jgi:hypothetical protein
MAYAQESSAASPKGVSVKVSVVGRNGYGLKKSKITFSILGKVVGIIDPSNGSGSIVLPDTTDPLSVQAEFGTSVVQRDIYAGEEDVTIQLDEDEPLLKAFLPTMAMCPDGKTGQPCVTCSISGKQYQICA